MKIYYNNTFSGYYPVGASAVVVARNRPLAASTLQKKLKEIGLGQEVEPKSMVKVSTTEPKVIILQDGNY
jgi:hypothetical protein